jgi:acetate kinase
VGVFRDGVGIDVSMGASPQSGLPQNNRVGDVDVFAVLYMMKQLGLGPDEMSSLLGSKAGLAGVSGKSGDVRDLEEAAAAGDARSRLALDLFVRSVRHYVGAFLLELGGVDVITFSGGIGENSAAIRSEILRGLGELGIVVDEQRNRGLTNGGGEISAGDSRVRILVVPANEELIVARETAATVAALSTV